MIAILVFIFIVTYTLWIIFKFRTSHVYKCSLKFPGPRVLPLLGNLLEFGNSNGDVFNALNNLYQRYGKTFRVYLGHDLMCIITKPEDLEIIMSNVKYIDKSEEYRFLRPWLGTGLLTSTGMKWKSHRRILTPTFHFKILEDFIDIFNTNADIFVEVLKNKVSAGLFDVHSEATMYTLDVVCEAALGVKVNAQLNTRSEYVRAVKNIARIIFLRSFIPWLRNEYTFPLVPSGRRHQKALNILHNKSREVIKERKAQLLESTTRNEKKPEGDDDIGVKKKLAFLDMLLQSTIDGQPMPDEDIREEVDTFMFEGHDTTSSGISFTLAMLAAHPDIQNKVVAEIEQVLGDSKRQPSYRDYQEMKYLEQVIKETLRLYPSVPLFAREIHEDVQLTDGYTVPKGSTVGFLIFNTHRMEEHFPSPEKFDPDRFDSSVACTRHPYAYVPFSAGPRNCIGQKFAMLVMKAGVVKVLQNYVVKTERVPKFNLVNELILKSSRGINIIVNKKK